MSLEVAYAKLIGREVGYVQPGDKGDASNAALAKLNYHNNVKKKLLTCFMVHNRMHFVLEGHTTYDVVHDIWHPELAAMAIDIQIEAAVNSLWKANAIYGRLEEASKEEVHNLCKHWYHMGLNKED